jgi:hypothetical protein
VGTPISRDLDACCALSDGPGVLVHGGDESYERRGHVVLA